MIQCSVNINKDFKWEIKKIVYLHEVLNTG